MKSLLKRKSISLQRYLNWHFNLRNLNVRIAEFPKSGGTWLGNMLSDLSGLPFPQRKYLPIAQCIEHSHYTGPTQKKTIVLIRDGRDIMVSAYFHFLFQNNKKPKGMIDHWRSVMNFKNVEDVEQNLPKFIDKFSREFTIGGKKVSWSDHVTSYDYNNPQVILCRYEDLITKPAETLRNISEQYNITRKCKIEEVVKKNSFEYITGRRAGEEDRNQFHRKGIVGDWKNYFNEHSLDIFYMYHGRALKNLGYV